MALVPFRPFRRLPTISAFLSVAIAVASSKAIAQTGPAPAAPSPAASSPAASSPADPAAADPDAPIDVYIEGEGSSAPRASRDPTVASYVARREALSRPGATAVDAVEGSPGVE